MGIVDNHRGPLRIHRGPLRKSQVVSVRTLVISVVKRNVYYRVLSANTEDTEYSQRTVERRRK